MAAPVRDEPHPRSYPFLGQAVDSRINGLPGQESSLHREHRGQKADHGAAEATCASSMKIVT